MAEPERQAVLEALTAKGLTEVDRAQADIIIHLHQETLPKEEISTWAYLPLPPGQSRVGGVAGSSRPSRPSITSFEERTVSVEIFDNRTKALVWVGRCTSEATAEVKAEAVRQMLVQFPVESPTTLAVR